MHDNAIVYDKGTGQSTREVGGRTVYVTQHDIPSVTDANVIASLVVADYIIAGWLLKSTGVDAKTWSDRIVIGVATTSPASPVSAADDAAGTGDPQRPAHSWVEDDRFWGDDA